MKKPKMYRKTKKSKGSNIADWNPSNNTGGGRVDGTIIGPMSSVGTTMMTPPMTNPTMGLQWNGQTTHTA